MPNNELLNSLTDLKVIGEYDDQEIVSKLQEMGELSKDVDDILKIFNSKQPWQYTTHQVGYIAPHEPGTEKQDIQAPSAIAADTTLKNSRINIHLDCLRIFKYPGGGIHNVLVAFNGQNQVANSQESVSFSQTYQVSEGDLAGVIGYPVFIGLNTGSQGITLECSTVNVKNEADRALLSALKSSPFQTGLKLLTTAQPAIAPFTTLTVELAKVLAQRNQNVAVQKLALGLDFEDGTMGGRLAVGNYIAIQAPTGTLDWNKWIYQPGLGIVHKADSSPLEYNYLIFRVSRYSE